MPESEEIKYWLELSDYDLKTANAMLKTKRYLYVGFMCHQAIEKLLKALYVKINSATPPYTHSLIELAKKNLIYEELSSEQKDFLDIMQPLNIQARYPVNKDRIFKTLNLRKCEDIIKKTRNLSRWIKKKL